MSIFMFDYWHIGNENGLFFTDNDKEFEMSYNYLLNSN